MKKILIVLAVLVLILGLLGSFATLGNTSGGSTGSEDTTTAAERITVSDTLPEDDVGLIATYTNGMSDPEGAIILGNISSSADDFTMIGVSFKDLSAGKTYTVSFSLHVYMIQTLKPECFWLRTGGANGALKEVSIGTSDGLHFNGSFSFTAESSSAEFLIRKISYTTDSDMISTYGAQINQYSTFKIYEGGDTE